MQNNDANRRLMDSFPPMLFGKDLDERLMCMPEYSPDICQADAGTRLIQLSRMADIYIPSQMTREIYSKLYLSMRRALEKKQTMDSVRQGVQNHRRIIGQDYNSVLGGEDSFSILGKAGIGKSTAIARSLMASGADEVITLDAPYTNIIPCISVQCPHDCSVKGMLLSILGAVDTVLGTRYQERAVVSRLTVDNLIGVVSQVAANHILLIVVDECQNIIRNRHGMNVVSALTQLINSSGIAICLVGLPETELFFREEMHLARRSIGLSYTEMTCDDFFVELCHVLYSYQYVANPRSLTPEVIEVLYQCSGGVIGILLSLLVEAQQVAILSGKEELTREVITETFRTRMRNVRDFVEVKSVKRPQTAGNPAIKEKVLKTARAQTENTTVKRTESTLGNRSENTTGKRMEKSAENIAEREEGRKIAVRMQEDLLNDLLACAREDKTDFTELLRGSELIAMEIAV